MEKSKEHEFVDTNLGLPECFAIVFPIIFLRYARKLPTNHLNTGIQRLDLILDSLTKSLIRNWERRDGYLFKTGIDQRVGNDP